MLGTVLSASVRCGKVIISGVSNTTEDIYREISVVITGRTPLLMNRLNPETLKSRSRMRMAKYSTIEDAKNSAYMAEIEGRQQLYIPSQAIYSMLINSSKMFTTGRKSLAGILAGTVRIEPEKIPLGTDHYEVDERPVVIKGQRILKGRARIDQWKAAFKIVFDAKRLPEGIDETIENVLDDAGVRMGLLDFRPQHKGWFGTFRIEKFELQELDKPKNRRKEKPD